MKKQINDLLLKMQNGENCIGETANQLLDLFAVSGSLRFSEREVDFAYLCGVFNTSGIDGLHNEIQRLKELGKEPHDIIEACRKRCGVKKASDCQPFDHDANRPFQIMH